MNHINDGLEPSPPSFSGRGSRPIEKPAGKAIDPAPSVRWLGDSLLHGCNIYHERTVICADIDLGILHDQASGSAGADFAGRFIARFHDASHTPPTARIDPGFIDALHSANGLPFADVLFEAILSVERRLAFARYDFVPIAMASVEPIASPECPGKIRLIWETRHPAQSRAATKLALAGLLELLPASLHAATEIAPVDFDAGLTKLLNSASRRQTSTTTSVIVLAAHARGIPCESIGGPHLQLGHGAAQRLVHASAPADVTLAAAQLSRNKRRTTQRLRQVGLPVTRQITAASVKQALAAAEKLRYPVVVKPQNGKQAGGVSVGIGHAEEIAPAYERAHAAGSGVLVEEFVQGKTYRLLVIGGRFAAALEIAPPTVTGDGKSSIDELIETLNRDPMRDSVHLFRIEIDDDLRACLARDGLTLADVPAKGTEVPLRTAANVAVGGVHADVTDLVHPSHRELAERAAWAIGLSVAGIDVVSSDIGRSCEEAGTRIIEVNARPGMCMHTFPPCGRSRDVAGAMLEQTFPPDSTGRIPTALVIGQHGANAVARKLDAMLNGSGKTAGLITRKEAQLAGQPLSENPLKPHKALAMMHRDPRLQALVMAVSPRIAVSRGLTLDRADTVMLLSPGDEDDPEVYRQAVVLAVRVARGPIILDAGNTPALGLLREMQATGAIRREQLIVADPSTSSATSNPPQASDRGEQYRLLANVMNRAMDLSEAHRSNETRAITM